MSAWLIVFRKELLDALRDRRTLAVAVISSVMIGPVVLLALSALIGTLEQQAERREIVAAGMEHAPSLRNFLERQTYTITEAPADHRRQIADSKLGTPVLVIPPDFERRLAEGRQVEVELLVSSANSRTEAAAPRVAQLVQAYAAERGMLHLLMRGVAPSLVQGIVMQQRDLANAAARGARLTAMIPIFLFTAMLYGLMAAAMDTTAGERERQSLEPLLTAPVGRLSLVTGKWAAVASLGMLVAVLSVLSFLPGQWLLRSEALRAAFHFGPREALLLLGLLLPLAAAMAATMMAIAIRCKTFKEAQTNNTLLVLLVTMLPLVNLFAPDGEQPWHLAVPVLAQTVLMGRVLKEETIAAADLLLPLGVCGAMVGLALWWLTRSLTRMALR